MNTLGGEVQSLGRWRCARSRALGPGRTQNSTKWKLGNKTQRKTKEVELEKALVELEKALELEKSSL